MEKSGTYPSTGHCDPILCNKDRTDISINVWKDGSGETIEAFCVSGWTSLQFVQLRSFISKLNQDSRLICP
jgi:hypothetical protein